MPDDPRIAAYLRRHKSPVPREPAAGALHNATIDPSRQHPGSLTAGAHEYDRSPTPRRPCNTGPARWGWPPLPIPREFREPLKPLYTEKLPTSPAFKTVAELAQKRRDFWSKIIARGAIAMMVAAPVIAFWKGTGTIPAGAFVAGMIIFIATCFVNGNCRSRV